MLAASHHMGARPIWPPRWQLLLLHGVYIVHTSSRSFAQTLCKQAHLWCVLLHRHIRGALTRIELANRRNDAQPRPATIYITGGQQFIRAAPPVSRHGLRRSGLSGPSPSGRGRFRRPCGCGASPTETPVDLRQDLQAWRPGTHGAVDHVDRQQSLVQRGHRLLAPE